MILIVKEVCDMANFVATTVATYFYDCDLPLLIGAEKMDALS